MSKLRLPLPALNADAGLLVLRVALAVILVFHGVFKVEHGIDWMKEPLSRLGLPLSAGYGAYLAELVAPVMLVAGAWTRLAALVVVGDMVMALVTVMGPQILVVNPSGGGWGVEVEAMILCTAIGLFLTGGGKYSAVRD
jgi:putative oxidoreductase